MNRFSCLGVAFTLLLGPDAAHAAGLRTLRTLQTVVKAGRVTESGPQKGLRIRAPRGTELMKVTAAC